MATPGKVCHPGERLTTLGSGAFGGSFQGEYPRALLRINPNARDIFNPVDLVAL